MSRIGVGVIGAGMMGRRHAENAARRIDGAALVAVYDHASFTTGVAVRPMA